MEDKNKRKAYNHRYYLKHKEKWSAYPNDWGKQNPEKRSKYNKEYSNSARGKEAAAKATKKYYENNAEKIHARWKANTALKAGKIKKDDMCYGCKTKGYTEMHHPDYSKPLDIVWFCRLCHRL